MAKDDKKGKGAPTKGGGQQQRSGGGAAAPAVGGGSSTSRASAPSIEAGPNEIPEGYVPRLKKKYNDEVLPALLKEFGYPNKMRVPASRRWSSISAWETKPARTPRRSTVQ